jgi:hypothetical protein
VLLAARGRVSHRRQGNIRPVRHKNSNRPMIPPFEVVGRTPNPSTLQCISAHTGTFLIFPTTRASTRYPYNWHPSSSKFNVRCLTFPASSIIDAFHANIFTRCDCLSLRHNRHHVGSQGVLSCFVCHTAHHLYVCPSLRARVWLWDALRSSSYRVEPPPIYHTDWHHHRLQSGHRTPWRASRIGSTLCVPRSRS